MRPRHIAPVALVLGLTVAGFLVARLLAQQDARRDSEHRAEIAAAQIHDRVAQGGSLTESLRRFMLDRSGTGVTSAQFARNALRWLSPPGFPAAAWVEQVPDSGRAAYERRIGQPVVTPDERHRVVPTGSRSSYLPATLVSGFDPLAVPGIDLSGTPGMALALRRATRLNGAAATAVGVRNPETSGLFLVAPAPNLIDEVLQPGYAMVFVSERTLHAAATDTPTLAVTAAGGPAEAPAGMETVRASFVSAGQRFDVVVPRRSVEGAAEALPWLILVAGLVLAGLAAALGVNAARRTRAQDQLDRIFNMSPDLIAVANFDGHFTRVNPAAQQILGYTEEELLTRPYLDLVHPDDRERTAAEAAAIGEGKKTLSFENRYARKDGSYRVLEWTSSPVVEERAAYAVARDVTERRDAESELERLAGEQAALRRVATLVAKEAAPADVLAKVAEEVANVIGDVDCVLGRDEGDGTVGVVAAWGAGMSATVRVGERFPVDGNSVVASVLSDGGPCRIDDYSTTTGSTAERGRQHGIRSAAGCPIVVGGRVWGVVAVARYTDEPLPAGVETRITQFTDLAATAIANAEARAEVERLADEQVALRRVATLVAREASRAEVFTAIAEEIGRLLGTEETRMLRYEDHDSAVVMARWGQFEDIMPVGSRLQLDDDSATGRVFRTGQPARIDYASASGPTAEQARSAGIRCTVATPIQVEGQLWGSMVTGTNQEAPLPPETESRLAQFTELMATAIANTESRARAERLTDEQAARRRVATLVAEGVPPSELFHAVAREVGTLLGGDLSGMIRYEDDATVTTVATWAALGEHPPVPDRWRTEPGDPTTMIAETSEPARVDDWTTVPGPIAAFLRDEVGVSSSVGSPIVVEGRLWGALAVHSKQPVPLPPETATRIAQFADLVATAIANAEARAEVERLAEEQAALRRVATLVAEGAAPTAVFDAVAGEMEALLDADQVALNRFEPGAEIAVLAHRGLDVARTPVGSRVSHEGESVTATVRRMGRPARMEDYEGAPGALAELARDTGLRASVAAPIVVDGRLWGIITASWKSEESPPADTEERMARFAQLLDTAIANAEARTEVERLAEEQAALRRVATLVAEGVSPTEVFDAVAAEVERVLGADRVSLSRYEPGAEITVLAHRGSGAELVPTGSRLSHEGDNVQEMVRRTERPARMEDFHGAHGRIAEVQRTMGVRAVVAAPVVVDGRLWGVIGASWVGEESPPADTEERVAQFAGLLETAIANADSRDQLTASRARLVTEGDEARRRVVRDLHDGAQQRLVHTIVTLKLAQRAFREEDGKAESLLREALEHAEQGNEELRELAHGILPAILTRGGLRAGIDAVVMRLDLPVRVDIPGERFPEEIEASVYFIVAEALTNVVKHSHAEHAEVRASVEDGMLHVEVRDDGIGGADPSGHGLVGMGDRVAALGGQLRIESPAGGGTLVAAALPFSGG